MLEDTTGRVVAVCRNAEPGLPKLIVDEVRLIEDWGVEGDYHAGKFVRHRYLAKKDPTQPNLRQVCIVDAAAFAAMRERNLQIGPGMMGENITVEGVAVMQLAIGTRLSISEALVEVTEVRIPCKQLNGIVAGLLKAVSPGAGARRRRGGRAGGCSHRVSMMGLPYPLIGAGIVEHGDTARSQGGDDDLRHGRILEMIVQIRKQDRETVQLVDQRDSGMERGDAIDDDIDAEIYRLRPGIVVEQVRNDSIVIIAKGVAKSEIRLVWIIG